MNSLLTVTLSVLIAYFPNAEAKGSEEVEKIYKCYSKGVSIASGKTLAPTGLFPRVALYKKVSGLDYSVRFEDILITKEGIYSVPLEQINAKTDSIVSIEFGDHKTLLGFPKNEFDESPLYSRAQYSAYPNGKFIFNNHLNELKPQKNVVLIQIDKEANWDSYRKALIDNLNANIIRFGTQISDWVDKKIMDELAERIAKRTASKFNELPELKRAVVAELRSPRLEKYVKTFPSLRQSLFVTKYDSRFGQHFMSRCADLLSDNAKVVAMDLLNKMPEAQKEIRLGN